MKKTAIEHLPTKALTPYAKNARTHSPHQIQEICASIEKFGFTNPVLIDADNGIIAGHGRVMAAARLKLKEVPCIRLAHLTEDQKQAYIIADNKLALNAGWNEDLLRSEITELLEKGFDVGLTGFPQDELDALFAIEPETNGDPNGVTGEEDEEPEKKPISKPGDVYEFTSADGKRIHRLVVGDSTSKEAVDTLMGTGKAQLVFTDPPYGVSYESTAQGKLQNDEKRDDDLAGKLLAPAIKQASRVAAQDAAFYIWHASTTRRDFEWAMNAAGLEEKQYLVWVKPSLVLGRSDYHWQHEPCYYAQKAGQKARYLGDRAQTTTWELENLQSNDTVSIEKGIRITDGDGNELFIQTKAPKAKKYRLFRMPKGQPIFLTGSIEGTDAWKCQLDPANEYIHPTQKPIGLAQKEIDNHLEENDIVLDLFGGSGSTLVAAETKRTQSRLMELDPKFADRIVRRFLETFPGTTCTRNGEPHHTDG